MTTTKTIWCSLQIEGTHSWPNCPIEEVQYLQHEHRHIFHIKVFFNVTHSDRDIEFIWQKHLIEESIKKQYFNPKSKLCEFGYMSCEMIASELLFNFNAIRVEVNEDGENGAVVEYV